MGNTPSAAELQAAAAVDTILRCDEECERAKEVDNVLRWVLLAMWVVCVMYFVMRARNGRARMAFFKHLQPVVPVKKLCKMDGKEQSGQGTKVLSAGQIAAIQTVLKHKGSSGVDLRRGSIEWKQQMARAESTRAKLVSEATTKLPARLPPIDGTKGNAYGRKVVPDVASQT